MESSFFRVSNFVLNIIIALLIVIIGLLVYSLSMKFNDDNTSNLNNKNDIKSEIIQVEVLNGCGAIGVADKFTEYLRERNFDVVKIGNYKDFDVDETKIIDRYGNLVNAKTVANVLGVSEKRVFTLENKNYLLDVSIVIGKDYYLLNPIK